MKPPLSLADDNQTFGNSIFAANAERFAREFDKASFRFSHRLADHALFDPDRLLRLARHMASDPNDVYYDAGDIDIDQRWDRTAKCTLPIDELLRRIETAGAWVVLRRAEKDPEYGALLNACMSEIESLSGRDLGRAMKVRNAIIFINSPNRVSTYHIDRECNFLLQVRGTKTISIFDRADRVVLPEEEIERFWAVDNNAAVYKPQHQDRAAMYELHPGDAVHIPVNMPHWVRNGPTVSVSISINFQYHDAILADIYRANHWLRRIGLRPTPPHRSPLADEVKRFALRSARGIHNTTRHLTGRG